MAEYASRYEAARTLQELDGSGESGGDALAWAENGGMLEDSSRSPDETATGQEMVTAMYRMYLEKNPEAALEIPGDGSSAVSENPQTEEAMDWAVNTGLVSGDGSLDRPLSREEMQALSDRFAQQHPEIGQNEELQGAVASAQAESEAEAEAAEEQAQLQDESGEYEISL